MKLSICCATHTDFDALYFTIQSIRLNHPELMMDTEFVIVDNSPRTKHSEMIHGLVANMHGQVGNVKYVEMNAPVGTSPSRNRLFAEATGDYVLVMDCHILLAPGALESLLGYYAENPDTGNIITGPMLYDNLIGTSTHFDNNLRSEMLGTWGSAWQCNCDPDEGVRFAMDEDPNSGELSLDGKTWIKPRTNRAYSLTMEKTAVTKCTNCGNSIPIIPWHGHEKIMDDFHKIGSGLDDVPFEIPGHGLGLFSCKRDKWLGFPAEADGFGGEELCVHELFRQAGQKAICIPQLKWLHKFGRPYGIPYPVSMFKKVRNYILWCRKLGWDTKQFYDHFVQGATPGAPQETQKFSKAAWDKLVADPINMTDEFQCSTCGNPATVHQPSPMIADASLLSMEHVYTKVRNAPRDLDEHMPKLRELAELCPVITEISARRESTIAFMAANPKILRTFNTDVDAVVLRAREFAKDATDIQFTPISDSSMIPTIEETDLLFIDTEHHGKALEEELLKYAGQVKRFIVLHDTEMFGMQGQPDAEGKPQIGMMSAIGAFCRSNPKWTMVYHTTNQYGLSVLGCQAQDKKPLPGTLTVLANATQALKDIAISGGAKVTDEQYEARLQTCATCPARNGSRCALCGCFVESKAAYTSQECPQGIWPKLEMVS